MSEHMHLPAVLTKQLGPLPVGAWGAAILGGLGISYYLRRHGSSGTATDTTPAVETPTTATTPGTGGAAISDPSVIGRPGGIDTPTDPDTAGPPTSGYAITTNAQWRQQAVKLLIGAGRTGISAELAIASYLAGRRLTPRQEVDVNTALAGLGPTPYPVPQIRTTAGPRPATPHPTKGHPATGNHGHMAGHGAHPDPTPGGPRAHSPIAHHTQPTHGHHSHGQAHPAHRRDTGTATNP